MSEAVPHAQHHTSDADLKTWIRERATAAGLDDVAFTSAAPLDGADRLRDWLAAGNAGTMHYLERPERHRPADLLEGARSVVCALVHYAKSPAGRSPIAAYAQRDDYHRVLREALRKVADDLESVRPGSRTRVLVDTAPLLERAAAARAGLGWVGKSTMLVHLRHGTFTLLGEILWTEEVPPDPPAVDHCGSCTACLDACPTDALAVPYRLEAQECLSYWTIEHRGEIPERFVERLEGRVFGCDACLEACPFGGRAVMREGRLLPTWTELRDADRRTLLERTRASFGRNFGATPIERTRKHGLLRNLRAAARSRGECDEDLEP